MSIASICEYFGKMAESWYCSGEKEQPQEAKAQLSVSQKVVGCKHVVMYGECLWSIAEKFYGSGSEWMRIYDANVDTIKDPDKIYPGQVLYIP